MLILENMDVYTIQFLKVSRFLRAKKRRAVREVISLEKSFLAIIRDIKNHQNQMTLIFLEHSQADAKTS